jgi:hypothetical protein
MGILMMPLAGLLGVTCAPPARSATTTKDSLGNRMDTAKVIPSPTGGYLAVYHSGQVCHLATSTDLMEWTHQAVIDQPATQPTIAATPRRRSADRGRVQRWPRRPTPHPLLDDP